MAAEAEEVPEAVKSVGYLDWGHEVGFRFRVSGSGVRVCDSVDERGSGALSLAAPSEEAIATRQGRAPSSRAPMCMGCGVLAGFCFVLCAKFRA